MHIPTIQIADIVLPPEMERLRDLAYDLWWSWSPQATRLFTWIDPDHWRRYHNPVQLLINVERHHWDRLLADPEFRRAYDSVIQALDAYRARARWFEQSGHKLAGPIAYFSMEFGIHESLGVYSGGLGVLAGDHCKAASDLGVPLVGVGLLYRSGYFRQTVDFDGFQQHIYPDYDFARLPVLPVESPGGGVLTVPVDLPGRVVQAAVWKAQVGRVPVLMLDTDLPLNDPADRPITGILYVRGREMRLCQEIVLGIGGVRALRALDIWPSAYHMNEGHVAFLGLERARERVRRGDGLSDALADLALNAVFTTHTPVPAGNETFDRDLVRRYVEPWTQDVGGDPEVALNLGMDNGSFNLTVMAIRLSSSVNGVSRLHGEVSSAMWRRLWPDQPERRVTHVTNGVHTQSWIGPEMRALFTRRLGADWEDHLLEPEYWNRVHEIPDEELWAAHRSQKERLIRFVRERVRLQSARDGRSPDELRAIEGLLDVRALTIGFARRFATYKRANLVLSDLEAVASLVNHPQTPIQFVFAGKAHPHDRPAKQMLQQVARLMRDPRFAGKVLFLEDYDINLGRLLVQGVDVWLNNPRRPLEACGTSGQKIVLNGGLNLSILDGWWAEAYDGLNGFAIGMGETHSSTEVHDTRDGQALHRALREEVIPLYYDRDRDGLPRHWIARMKRAIRTLGWRFSADRMVMDYVLKCYIPAAGGTSSDVSRV